MENYLKKYFIKIKKRKIFILGPLLLVVILTLIGNIVLRCSQRKIVDAVNNQRLAHEVSLGKMFYIFPNVILFKDSSLTKSLILPTSTIRFAPWALLAKRKFLITDIVLHQPIVNSFHFGEFIRDNLQTMASTMQDYPKGDLKISLKGADFDFSHLGIKKNNIRTDFDLHFKNDAISGEGVIHRTGELPVRCLLNGFVTSDGFSFENISLSRENLHIKFWTELNKNMLQLNGFALLNSPNENLKPERLYKHKALSVEQLSEKSIFILDIDGLFNVALPWIRVEKFNFTVNNAPMHVKGNILLSDSLKFDMASSFYPASRSGMNMDKFEQVDMNLSGNFQNGILSSNGDVNIYFDKKEGGDLHSSQRLEITMNDMAITPDKQAQWKINLKENRTSFWNDGRSHTIRLNDMQAYISSRENNSKEINITSLFYDGELKGKMWLDTDQIPFKVNASLDLDNISTQNLNELFDDFANVEGRLFGNIEFVNQPKFSLHGGLNIQQGVLNDYALFTWLADSFELSSLKNIHFQRADAYFSVDASGAGLNDIRLEAEDVKIKGHFNITESSLVSSALSLKFGRNLLGQSRKGKRILKLFKTEVPYLDFNFKLSGSQDAVNFQWVPSDVKTRIQGYIPDFIERKIERNIDQK